jgi:hypothetical protein
LLTVSTVRVTGASGFVQTIGWGPGVGDGDGFGVEAAAVLGAGDVIEACSACGDAGVPVTTGVGDGTEVIVAGDGWQAAQSNGSKRVKSSADTARILFIFVPPS